MQSDDKPAKIAFGILLVLAVLVLLGAIAVNDMSRFG